LVFWRFLMPRASAAADAQAVRRPGSVVGNPFFMVIVGRDSGTRVVPASACRCAWCRCGTQARGADGPLWGACYAGPWCGLPVVPGVIACWAWFQSTPVVPGVIVCWAWFRCRLVMPAWYHADVVGPCGWWSEATDRAAEHAHAVDAATRPRDRCYFESQNQPGRDPDLAVAAHLMGKPFGTRGSVIGSLFVIGMRQIAHPERALCRLRRAGARCAGCGMSARYVEGTLCRSGTKARCAEGTLWVACSCAERGSRLRSVVVGLIPDARDPDRTPGMPAWFQKGVVGTCVWQPKRRRSGRRTRPCSRPLRARDRSHFDSDFGRACGG